MAQGNPSDSHFKFGALEATSSMLNALHDYRVDDLLKWPSWRCQWVLLAADTAPSTAS